jgi:hypothetical protein
MKPSLFIGSSSEGLEVARAIEDNLHKDAEVTIWNEGVFGLNRGNLESLVAALERFDFAILVITPDDVTISRDETMQAPRDNVMFELGLFMGRLGRNRTYAFSSDAKNMRLPSDLAGVSLAIYQHDRSDGNLQAATSPGCNQIRRLIRELGISDARGAQRLSKATHDIEGITLNVAQVVNLLAQSRVLELEVIKSQFGAMIDGDFLQKIINDLEAISKVTTKSNETQG